MGSNSAKAKQYAAKLRAGKLFSVRIVGRGGLPRRKIGGLRDDFSLGIDSSDRRRVVNSIR
jgi:hypothetical protein